MIPKPGSNASTEVENALHALVIESIHKGNPPYRIKLPSCSQDDARALVLDCRSAGWASGLLRHEGDTYITLSIPTSPTHRSEEERG